MQTTREPRLIPVPIDQLRPTQVTVGYREVARKQRHWIELGEDAGTYLGNHMIPVVIGPKARPYVIDHHHLARALLESGQAEVLTTVVADLRRLSQDAFWVFLDNRGWLHPFDAKGARLAYKDIPKKIAQMGDDPFRSLAGAVREGGGFAKDTTPFSEFLWADYFRRRFKTTLLERDFDRAVAKAIEVARGREADFLPGWCGVDKS